MKEWTCICGSKVFILTRAESTIVNFNTEGAVEGHPHLSKGYGVDSYIRCNECHANVPYTVRTEMLKEII